MQYTREEVILLASMFETQFHIRSLVDTAQSMPREEDALTFILEVVGAEIKPFEPPFLQRPLKEVPRFISSPDRVRRILAAWRLEIAK